MNKIPIASEFCKIFKPTGKTWQENFHETMIEFAKLHVKAALQEALESIPCLGSSTDIATYEEVEKAVLNAYSENLIK